MADKFVCVRDFKDAARYHCSRNAWNFFNGGAAYEQTLKDNEAAFTRWRLRPRILQDITKRDVSTTVLGEKIAFPIGISPASIHKLAHPDGEIATARAASAVGTVMIQSCASSYSIEEVAASSTGLRWFQLYISNDRKLTESLVRRAERAGFKALVLTVDNQLFGRRWAVLRDKSRIPHHIKFANFSTSSYDQSRGINIAEFVGQVFDSGISWKDIQWLKSITSLPIVLKGILTGEDAKLALQYGANAIMVSNHGGRQLDGVLASIDALPEVVHAVQGQCEVYLDGGVTTGTDVIKALALGARAVFIARAAIWGLACQGETGVKNVLTILKEEFDLALALLGCASIQDIKPSHLQYDYQTPKL